MGGARRRPLVVCWGELIWDRFPDGRRLGGAPANVAYHAAVRTAVTCHSPPGPVSAV